MSDNGDQMMMDNAPEMMMEGEGEAPAEMMAAASNNGGMDAAPAGEMMMEANNDDEKKPLVAMPSIPGVGGWNDVGSDKTVQRKLTLTPCCCCLCNCSNELTVDQTCLGCFPIKCGVVSIGIFIWILTIYQVCVAFFLILNEYVRWWFPFVSLLILVP